MNTLTETQNIIIQRVGEFLDTSLDVSKNSIKERAEKIIFDDAKAATKIGNEIYVKLPREEKIQYCRCPLEEIYYRLVLGHEPYFFYVKQDKNGLDLYIFRKWNILAVYSISEDEYSSGFEQISTDDEYIINFNAIYHAADLFRMNQKNITLEEQRFLQIADEKLKNGYRKQIASLVINHFALMTYFNHQIEEERQWKELLKEEPVSVVSSKSKNNKRNTTYSRPVIRIGALSVCRTKTSKLTKSKILNRQCTCWRVRGHDRHYKNGKIVHIDPYFKGLERDKKIHNPKTYEIL